MKPEMTQCQILAMIRELANGIAESCDEYRGKLEMTSEDHGRAYGFDFGYCALMDMVKDIENGDDWGYDPEGDLR